jgi:transposase
MATSKVVSASSTAPWDERLSPTMRQTQVAGERLFVDYAGATLEVINGLTGEVITAQLFVAALGHLRRGDPDAGARRPDRLAPHTLSRSSAG